MNFEEIESVLRQKGPKQAVDQLIAGLRDNKDYHALFYATLLKTRLELGLPPVQVGAAETEAPQPMDQRSVRDLITGRDWLFADEGYHIDISHLSSVIRFSLALQPCEEQNLAIELCEYGLKLSPRYRYDGPPPFENQY